MQKTILVTGGAGFIGSHLVRHLLQSHPGYRVVVWDKLTYAGNLENLADIRTHPGFQFERGDICDGPEVRRIFREEGITDLIHLAAESHVDRSILDPLEFVRTNVLGTAVLLEAAREAWKNDYSTHRFYHVSTDEVFGSLGETGAFSEQTPYDPRSPYSASKAGSDHLVRAYAHTYGLHIVISNCSNNFGSHQFPEKLIPLMIRNILAEQPLPVYGEGRNVRDWLYVNDHVAAIDLLFHRGKSGETYCIGGSNEWNNLDLVRLLCRLMDECLGRSEGHSEKLIRFVTDRPGHDMRYAIDASRLRNEFGWSPSTNFEDALRSTIDWYLSHQEWVSHVTSGEYRHYYERQYAGR